MQEALKIADEAREDYIERTTNAWRYPVAANPDAWNAPFPLPGESPRDAYVRQLSTTPNRNYPAPGDDADDIEAQRQRWLSPGATAGMSTDASPAPAAAADRDRAFGEYLDRISNGWKAR